MADSQLTKKIKFALYKHTKAHLQGVYGAFEVVMGENTKGYGNEYVDFLTMNSDNEFRCYEIKVSKEDLRSHAQLSFYGDFNYVVIPDENLVPGLLKEAMHFISSTYGSKAGILVYHESAQTKKPYFTMPWKPKRQKIRIEQRIANMHNMVRSISRYVTKDLRKKEDTPQDIIFTV